MGRMRKTSAKLCSKCKYHSGGNNDSALICYYLVRTEKRRGCPVGKCDKYEKGRWIERCET